MHTWSLGVEMQFYTLVPILFNFVFLRQRFQSKLPLISSIIISLSLLLQANSREAVAFGFVFCRMWQFQAGMLAFFGIAIAQQRFRTCYDENNKDQLESIALLTAELEKNETENENLTSKKVIFVISF